MTVSPRTQIFEYLDGPRREDRFDRTVLDRTPLGKATTPQIEHYLANRRVLEQHLDEETVFDELARLDRQADDQTAHYFDLFGMASMLADETFDGSISQTTLYLIALGMLSDHWPVDQVRYALGTLDTAAKAKAA